MSLTFFRLFFFHQNSGKKSQKSGNKIPIKPEWANTTDEWHCGVFDMTKVFPDYLTSRMKKKNKEEKWSPEFNKGLGGFR